MADLETRQVNSLYKRINNEAVDEDRQANRRAIELSKKQSKLFSPDKKQVKVLPKKDFLNLKRVISKFSNTLNKYTLNYAKYNAEDELKDISSIQGQYDILCLFLEGIELENLDKQDYDSVIGQLNGLLPKLGEVKRLVYAIQGLDETVFERQVIDHIYNNFKANTYYPFGSYTNEDVVEVGRLLGEERARKGREQVETGMDNVDPEEQELPSDSTQFPIGAPIQDQQELDQLEEDKDSLTNLYEVLVELSSEATPPLRREINKRIAKIQSTITSIDSALDGSVEITDALLNRIGKVVNSMEDFYDFVNQ